MDQWVEKYRPTNLKEIAGNKKVAESIREWGKEWEPGKKPLLLHGPPGIGKTSAALALAEEMGWDVVEMNASDTRTADVVKRIGGTAANTGTLRKGGEGRRLLLIDEVDNLHGNKDRGGAAALTEIVKSPSQPVILVCNDVYEVSKGIRNNSSQIKFKRLGKRSIVKVLKSVSKKEDLVYEKEALEAIAERSDGDLRSAINDLQAIATDGRVKIEEVKDASRRDREESIFKALNAVLKGKNFSKSRSMLRELDETPEDLIHWLDENLCKVYSKKELEHGYQFLSIADRYLLRARSTRNYGFWGYSSEFMAGISQAKNSRKKGWTSYSFPSYWSKLGRTKKTRKLRKGIMEKISEKCHVSTNEARDEFIPLLKIILEKDVFSGRKIVNFLSLSENEVEFLTDKNVEKLLGREEKAKSVEKQNTESTEKEDKKEEQKSLQDF